jgi:acyl dehydratase
MNSLRIYWRAMQRKPGLGPGQTIKRIETTIKPSSIDLHLYNGLRHEWALADYGVLPPLFPAVTTFMTHLKHLSDPRFPFQAMGTVHRKTLIEQSRPVRLDEVVSFRCSVEGHRDVDRGVEFDLITESIVSGEVVSIITMTMFRKRERGKRDGVRQTTQVHNHLEARDAVWSVDRWTARRYARLTGDINPIHLSDLTARALGFKGMMLHGMWLIGRACAMHPVQMMARDIRFEADFRQPVLLPSDLRYRWWADEGVLEMRVLDQKAAKSHMIARLLARKPLVH